MASIQRMGLRTPITVRETDAGSVVLVAGRHRLEAIKRLGADDILAFAIDDSTPEDDVRLWEIAENLHRAELTDLERSEHIAEWVRLTGRAVGQDVQRGTAGKFSEGGISKAARELPISGPTEGAKRKTVERALKIASLAEDVKQDAIAAGIDDNQAALLRVAKQPNPEAQAVAVLREKQITEARKANQKTDQLVKERRIDAIKEYLAARLDVTELHDLGEMLAGICDPLSKSLMREVA
jgi:ParB family transcriptional regulator, chromosome partitioning protein